MKGRIRGFVVLWWLAIALGLAACGAEEMPSEVFDKAVAKNAQLTDLDMTTKVDMKMESGSGNMDLEIGMDVKVSGLNTENPLYQSDVRVDMGVMGYHFGIDSNTCYADGYCYVETMGQKLKYAIDFGTISKSVDQNNAFAGISSGVLQDISMEKDGDNRIITFVGDPEAMGDDITNIMGMMKNQMALLGDVDIQMEMKEIKGTSVVNKDGYNEKMNMTIVLDMTANGETLTVNAETETELKNPGQAVEIAIPNPEEYEETDMGDFWNLGNYR